MDPLTVAGWGLVYAGIGSMVAKVSYSWIRCNGPSSDGREDQFVAFGAMLLWPLVVLTVGVLLLLVLLAPLGRVLAASWEWWLRD